MLNVVASNTLRYSNDPQINSPTPWLWYKTQTINVSAGITGTIRVTYNFGLNCSCYDDTVGCVSTNVRKNGVTVYSYAPGNCISSADSGAISITLLTTDTLELWVIETDCFGSGCSFPAYTSNFRMYYDLAGGVPKFDALLIAGN